MHRRQVKKSQFRREQKKKNAAVRAAATETLDWAVVVCTMVPGGALYMIATLMSDQDGAVAKAEAADASARADQDEHGARTSVFVAPAHCVVAGGKKLTRGDLRVTEQGSHFFLKQPDGIEAQATFAIRRVRSGRGAAEIEVGDDLTGQGLGNDDEGWAVFVFAGETARADAIKVDSGIHEASFLSGAEAENPVRGVQDAAGALPTRVAELSAGSAPKTSM